MTVANPKHELIASAGEETSRFLDTSPYPSSDAQGVDLVMYLGNRVQLFDRLATEIFVTRIELLEFMLTRFLFKHIWGTPGSSYDFALRHS